VYLKKTLLGRRQFLTIAGATSALAVTTGVAKAAGKAAAAGCNEGSGQTIKGVVMERPVHTPVIMQSMREMMAAGATVAGAPLGGFDNPPKATPGVYIGDGKYLPAESKADVVSGGKIGNALASGMKISAQSADLGGVYVKGLGSEYTLADAKIDLSGDGGMGLGGANSGASADDYATLTLRNCTITTSGKNRNATSVQNHGVLKVYNSTLTAHGVPFTPDITSTDQKKQLEIDGNSRAHVTLSNSYSYFYYSTIISEGWAALSTDGADGFVYLEANDCTVKTLKSGYGTYADGMCHNVINRCDFDVASMAAIIADESDVTFTDTKAKCGSYFALMHAIAGQTNVAATLKVTGGEITSKKAAVLVKSANVNISFDGSKIVSEKGVLLESCVSVDPGAAKLAHPKGQKVYGIHATFKNMDVAGDIVHTADKENRDMTVYLESTTLKGAIKDAYLSMNRLSKWIATADSNVTIVGDVDVSQIDAPAGVTITAAGSVSGKYKLASCGTLILQAS
jgi:hypothetical protein